MNKMAINTYLSTIESKKQMKKQNRKRTINTENIFTVARLEGYLGGWVKKVKELSTN